jgi:DNA-binding transcriptional MerR regulator
VAEESHHSIGEVLAMLKDEHADITISKIRFFESQGLIAPERTPSGYRKFTEADIERLRWILVQQRDNFLPLKVIKRRLDDATFDPTADVPAAPVDGPLPEPTLFTKRDDDPMPAPESGPETETETSPKTGTSPEEGAHDEAEPEPDPGPEFAAVPAAPPISEGDPLDVPSASVSLSPLELAESAGVSLGLVADLERLGLIQTVASGDGEAFDHEALVVTQAAGVFIARGVQPRHLRMFKVAADREAGVLEQLITPRLRKGGEAATIARDELNEMVRLGEVIHRSILRRSFGPQLD